MTDRRRKAAIIGILQGAALGVLLVAAMWLIALTVALTVHQAHG